MKATMTNAEKQTVTIAMMKPNAKPNAPTYKFVTINDMASALNDDNVDRFLEEFGLMLKSQIAFRDLCYSIAERQKDEPLTAEEKAAVYSMPEMTWIDD